MVVLVRAASPVGRLAVAWGGSAGVRGTRRQKTVILLYYCQLRAGSAGRPQATIVRAGLRGRVRVAPVMAQYRLHRLRTPGMLARPTTADIDRESALSPYLERLCFKSKTAWCGVVKHSCGGASQRAGKNLGQKSRKVELSPFLLPTILDPLSPGSSTFEIPLFKNNTFENLTSSRCQGT